MNCHDCKKGEVNVPFPVYESEMLHRERTEIRLWISVLIVTLALILSNAGWFLYESQFEVVYTTKQIIQDADNGSNLYIDEVDIYGNSDCEDNNRKKDA